MTKLVIDSAVSTTTTMSALSDENEPEYDVFVSHAWKDKEDFVDEFVQELRKLEIKVWYDISCIKWGESMREK